ncbi:hypothetical protein P3T76_013459 [Phytophthora citrophthora]|uniref:Uncharacterized protein n=1 Tax=Phytophthora citrophthora TaxID=4793 RepID=A0AAD9G408_9STRA|nr:hypothetical protein P3T76_013459 [Phytophthora citrophthora]
MVLANGRILPHPFHSAIVVPQPILSPSTVPNSVQTTDTPTRHYRSSPSVSDLALNIADQRRQATDWERLRMDHINTALSSVGLKLPHLPFPSTVRTYSGTNYLLNNPLIAVLSEFVRRTRVPPMGPLSQYGFKRPTTIGLIKLSILTAFRTYADNEVLDITSEGFRIHLTRPLPHQCAPPKNHNSALERINILRKKLRKEQDQWRCLVLDDDICAIWPEVFYTPFGAVTNSDKPPSEAGHTNHVSSQCVCQRSHGHIDNH